MTSAAVDRDERTVVLENASYRWAFHVFCYGLLAIIMYRGYARHETSLDLWALFFTGGMVASVYQWSHDILTRRWVRTAAVTMAVAAVVAGAIAVLMR